MPDLRFAILGTGFWAHYQLAAWQEVGGVECVAVYNRTRSKAEAFARSFAIPHVYDNPEQLLQAEQLDFVDIISDVGTHAPFAGLAATHRIPVICQKPMATSLLEATQMAYTCEKAGVPLFIHENWRWQAPIRQVRKVLDDGLIGRPFRARIDMISGFPVFQNQPFLKELDQFIVTDLGSHILDTARFLFGEAESLYCQTQRIHHDIDGEDVATVMMRMNPVNGNLGKVDVVCEMAYAGNTLEHDLFPQTYIFVEGECGSLELGPNYWIRVTTVQGTHSMRYPPPRYTWADPAYDVVHSSIVSCNHNLLQALTHKGVAETTSIDNLKTVRLVFACYEAAKNNIVVTLPD